MIDAIVTAFINLASWNVSPATAPVSVPAVRVQPRDARGRFVKVGA